MKRLFVYISIIKWSVAFLNIFFFFNSLEARACLVILVIVKFTQIHYYFYYSYAYLTLSLVSMLFKK